MTRENTVLHHLKLLWLFLRISVQNDAAYRVDFLANVFVTLAHFGAEIVGLWTIFLNTQSLGGWNAMEVLALLGVFRAMSGIIGLFISPNMRLIMEEIREGTLDFAILKPINTQFFTSFRRIVVWRLADVALGGVFITFACTQLSAAVSAPQLVLFLVMLVAGVVIIYAFWLVLATCAFWFTRINNIEMVFWNVFEAGRYPVDIYRPVIQRILTYLIPLAFITTYPAATLVGKIESGNVAVALAAATGALVLASAFWKYGLRSYSGASA